ncbi:unnamed protein product [Allacma fusca]|uniref:Protein CLEC16A homolog n=1 Tax=Allacma fusca TaxID=39272 RepID=A0A8J2NY37_9HEXA|nr:unnamed protein product [Allacma fusca]
MFRSKSWFGGGLWKPKNPHSLDHLKYLYNVLSKNQTVNEHNRGLLVETLRSIAEILIWGDQNDSTVFDFFLEKNMLSFFLKIMKQKCGSYVCVQLLQTLNILFENIRNETSLYYLLSNNHVNSIIVHKFDFSDEEVMAYYISFLKTLSLKLNSHTIHFFYNEHTNDFPLYTEAIKFFNNSESMVRIAVRTLTLNVYKVDDKSMLKFIRDKTAAPYFTNLVWFIGNHVLELDVCIRGNSQYEALPRLADLVAEHLDHLHYLNDILLLEIDDLNKVLTDHLLHRLLIPLYVTSLDKASAIQGKSSPKVSSILALFLLSQVFLIMTHPPLVRVLANIILNGNEAVFELKDDIVSNPIINSTSTPTSTDEDRANEEIPSASTEENPTAHNFLQTPDRNSKSSSHEDCSSPDMLARKADSLRLLIKDEGNLTDLSRRPFLSSIFDSLETSENDYSALFSLCLLQALVKNKGIHADLLDRLFHGGAEKERGTGKEEDLAEECITHTKSRYNGQLVDRLISIIAHTVKYESKVRVVTLQLAYTLLLKTVMKEGDKSCMGDHHLAAIEGAREENILLLQNYYKSDEMFLEIFEDEYLEMSTGKVQNVEQLLMDSHLLLPPAGSPLTGIAFDKRLPCGEVERSRRAMRVYFILRKLSLTLRNEKEKYLPLTNTQTCVNIDDNLDLTNSDIQSCIVITRDTKLRRFLVIDIVQLILVEPSPKRMGWGVVKFVGFLQDIEVMGDKDDSRCLHITVKSSPTNLRGSKTKTPLLSAKFMFDDHIRCMAAKQRLIKGKLKSRQRKLHMIARLLDLTGSSPSPPQKLRHHSRRPLVRSDRPLYNPIGKALPGLAMAVVSETQPGNRKNSRDQSPAVASVSKNTTHQDEEIPLGTIHSKSTNPGGTSHNGPQPASSSSSRRNSCNSSTSSSSAISNPHQSSNSAAQNPSGLHLKFPSGNSSNLSANKINPRRFKFQ